MLIETRHTEKSRFFMKKLQAVLEISKFSSREEDVHVHSASPPIMDEVLCEKRASYNSLELMKWVVIFQVGIFWVQILHGGV